MHRASSIFTKTDFSSQNDYDLIKSFVSQMSKGPRDEKWDKWERSDGIIAVSAWLHNFELQVREPAIDNLCKDHGSLIITLLETTAHYREISKKMFDLKIFQRLLRLVFFGPFLIELDYYEDFTFRALMIVLQLPKMDMTLSWSLRIVEQAFESDSDLLAETYQNQTIPLNKILIGSLFLQRNLTGMNATDFEGLMVSKEEMTALTEILFYPDSKKDLKLQRNMKTSYWDALVISPHLVQQWFNSLLIVESNRQYLCQENFFRHLIKGIQKFSGNEVHGQYSEVLEIVCITSLRALLLISHTCHGLPNYFVKEAMQTESKLHK